MISVNIMKCLESLKQVRSLACYEIRLNPPFYEGMPLPSQEYNSRFSFVLCVLAFDFAFDKGVFVMYFSCGSVILLFNFFLLHDHVSKLRSKD